MPSRNTLLPDARSSALGFAAAGALALVTVQAAPPADAEGPRLTVAARSDTVRVAPPTGEQETDRASILAALDEVEPGGTVHFGPGAYLVGEVLPVPQSGITLQAHPKGTTLRGCEPADYPRGQALREALASGDIGPEEYGAIVRACGLMELTGGGVAVRGFTIDHTRLGICISSCFSDPSAPVGDTVGGYHIERNTFRHSGNGVRGQVVSSDTTVIRDNRFVQTFHAVSFLEASHLHVVDNRISAPEPEETPGVGHVSFAIALGGHRNLVARNRIGGHPDGILLAAGPGRTTRRNVIRGNTIAVARNPLPDRGSPALASSDPADSTIVGVPLALHGRPVPTARTGRVSENLVEGNRILGAEGIGIELYRASGNRIAGNEVSAVVPRRPFPGNSVSTDPEPWRAANGSGVWLSPDSDGNEIVGNTFEDVEGAPVLLEGDDNRVELRSAHDAVRDVGSGNRVTAPDRTTDAAGDRPGPAAGAPVRHFAPTGLDAGTGDETTAAISVAADGQPADTVHSSGADSLARQVTIHRDAYGVPHVHGETDAATVFGYMYAQAEDAFPEIERSVAEMSGRLAEIDGEAAVSGDLYVRALRTEQLSRAEYARASSSIRAIADAWAAGLNRYLESHPKVEPRAIERFEPWQMIAVAGRSESIWVPPGQGLLETAEVGRAVDRREMGHGSNMWMVAPEKTASGRAMLFINPHNPPEIYLEGHLVSDEGLNVYGGHRPGRPFPVFGHTPRHGWALTNNRPDVADLWKETFDQPTNPLAYRYGAGYRIAEEWTDTLRVRTDSALVAREVTFRKTHHGPIVAVRDGVPLALRIARWEEGGTVEQFHAMARARSFEEFREAVARLGEITQNIGYADREGNIWFVANGAVPRRAPGFDWTRPVDGSDPRTEWRGYHALSELPQVLNPEAGWIMNTNHSPFRATAEGENPDPSAHPRYMARPPYGSIPVLVDSLGDNPRARASRRILEATDQFTFEAWADSTTSRRAREAGRDIPGLVAAWERLRDTQPERAARLRPPVAALRSWDHVSRHESVGMTLYTLLELTRLWSWVATLDPPPFEPPPVLDLEPTPWDRWDPVAGLEKVVAVLEREWGTWRVPYGELNRLQRTRDGRYRDGLPSTPVLGGPGLAGMIPHFIPMPVDGQKRWYGFVSGNSYVSVVAFGGDVDARTVNGSGQSFRPNSPHYTDQAALYGRGEYKRAWTTLEEARARAVASYRPGEER